MTLKTRIFDALNQLGPFALGSGSLPLHLDIDGGTVDGVMLANDQLACAFERIDVRLASLQQATIHELQKLSDKLSKQLGYLLEAISPVETDREGCVVQMRSNPPLKDDDGTSYYELLVRREGLSLCRFSKTLGTTRTIIPAHVTREVFGRLIQDFAGCV